MIHVEIEKKIVTDDDKIFRIGSDIALIIKVIKLYVK